MKIVRCVKKGKEIKVTPLGEEGFVQFPKHLREEGKMFAVEELVSSGKFWKAKGQIFKLVSVEEASESYIDFSEYNDWEGETWHFLAPESMPGVKDLMALIDKVSSESHSYEKLSKKEALVMSKIKNGTTYMDQYNLVTKVRTVPTDADGDFLDEFFYKGKCFEF